LSDDWLEGLSSLLFQLEFLRELNKLAADYAAADDEATISGLSNEVTATSGGEILCLVSSS
jgi:hypothetical protein